MADVLKTGDTVKLMSGGPMMTVAWVKDSTAHCVWFSVGTQTYPSSLTEASFPVGALRRHVLSSNGD